MMNSVDDIRNLFKSKLLNEKFTIDRTGQKTIEHIGASFLADQPSIFGAPNKKYIEKELRWYKSQITNVNAIDDKVPEAWQYAANDYGDSIYQRILSDHS